MNVATLSQTRIPQRLSNLYGPQAEFALELLVHRLQRFGDLTPPSTRRWSERDVVLITYGDQVSSSNENESPLQTQFRFLQQWQLVDLINTIHFLPFFPYSSDDGFSVIDYRSIDPAIGTWSDIREIGEKFRLMFDFVINHVSQESDWFQSFLAGKPPFDRYFIEVDPTLDLSCVTRPRSLPLLHAFETIDGEGAKHVWTTFSRDQVDLNYATPELLAEVVEILLEYVKHGARIIRLDAIAYLWKEVGTNCIHLPQTHEIVKLFRDVLDVVAPHVLLLTETNVPHDENVSYFGGGDEADMVYQFSLPPLLLDAFVNADAEPLKRWLAGLAPPPSGTSYFNFTASHDGVGVRPLEGHVDDRRLNAIVDRVRSNGGHVSMRRCADGSDAPYELNISYLDALADGDLGQQSHVQRFLATQAIMLSLQGMPAIYFHSLIGTPNDEQGVKASGIPRRINRRKYDLDTLNGVLESKGSMQRAVFEGIKSLLRIRIRQAAFHPDGRQTYVDSGQPNLLAFERVSTDSVQRVLVLANFGDVPLRFQVSEVYGDATDLLEPSAIADGREWLVAPAQVRWLLME